MTHFRILSWCGGCFTLFITLFYDFDLYSHHNMYEIDNVFNFGTILVLSLRDLYTNTIVVYGKPYICSTIIYVLKLHYFYELLNSCHSNSFYYV